LCGEDWNERLLLEMCVVGPERHGEVLEDVMDIVHAEEVLKWIETGRVKIKKIVIEGKRKR
jgi:Lhr-like helicase